MTRFSPRALLAQSAQAALLSANPEREPQHVAADAVEHADALLALLGQSAFVQDAALHIPPITVGDPADKLAELIERGR
ncbi:hypothetical protein [Deinococcus sp. NW-56]|uniref:hypothetical protein n=1 Tax=Deinococcus sp. NW-56 TaxID=2080419 RepID=UPI000CF52D06|nr:hypothetical protein [Deinococcus sp. NW-56]